jgi:hypothetical protein
MGDTWITDMTHFLDVLDPDADVPASARRFAEYMGRIVEEATVNPPLILLDTAIRCRRRPGRKPCPGHIRLICNDDVGEILWECTSCDDRGSISGWQGTPWDRSASLMAYHNGANLELTAAGPTAFEPLDAVGIFSMPGREVEVILENVEYSIVYAACREDTIPASILDKAEHCPEGVRVKTSVRNMAALRDYLLDIAVTEQNPSFIQLLGSSLVKMNATVNAHLNNAS